MTLLTLARRTAMKLNPYLIEESEITIAAQDEAAHIHALCEVLGCDLGDLLQLAK